jgi:hypothetical protein
MKAGCEVDLGPWQTYPEACIEDPSKGLRLRSASLRRGLGPCHHPFVNAFGGWRPALLSGCFRIGAEREPAMTGFRRRG